MSAGGKLVFIGLGPSGRPGNTGLSCAAELCPFCGGHPCAVLNRVAHPYLPVPRLEDYGADGVQVFGTVFCHACGSEGPNLEATLFDLTDYTAALVQVIGFWNKRGRHPELEVRQWERP
ncbi:hypothetical protein D3C79_884940 [compost metagenome]